MTQAALARAAGVTGQSVSNHETGKPMSLEALHAYARALGCRPEELSDPEAGEKLGRAAKAQAPAYLAVMEFLRLRGGGLGVTSEEVEYLTRHVDGGGASDPENIHVELLSRRFSSGAASGEEVNAFLELTNRKRVAHGLAPLRLTPEPPPPRQATRAAVPAKKSRA
jgi:transcriptional regulator with XRE-family HTH domain